MSELLFLLIITQQITERNMLRLVIVSDTHCTQKELPDGDVLIHCGDHTFTGTIPESEPALRWLSEQSHEHKVIIAGNHEVGWEADLRSNVYRTVPRTKPRHLDDFPNLIYLHNTGIEIRGLKFWGSPYQPHFYDWAFQKARGAELAANWAKMPDDTDVLITHGPPYGFGDHGSGERFGDVDLLERVLQVKPQLHCYGHAHAGYGQYFHEGIHFVNAAQLDDQYNMTNEPVVVEIENESI